MALFRHIRKDSAGAVVPAAAGKGRLRLLPNRLRRIQVLPRDADIERQRPPEDGQRTEAGGRGAELEHAGGEAGIGDDRRPVRPAHAPERAPGFGVGHGGEQHVGGGHSKIILAGLHLQQSCPGFVGKKIIDQLLRHLVEPVSVHEAAGLCEIRRGARADDILPGDAAAGTQGLHRLIGQHVRTRPIQGRFRDPAELTPAHSVLGGKVSVDGIQVGLRLGQLQPVTGWKQSRSVRAVLRQFRRAPAQEMV